MSSRGDDMSEEEPPGDGSSDQSGQDPAWKVDPEESHAHLVKPDEPGGKLVYVDEHGRRRRLPADVGTLPPHERRAAAAALSSALGAPDPGYARVAALERLAEMRAAGTLSKENYERERRRLMDYG